jgi:uncharacterized membrane protein YuzA (DUF378 family)
MPKIDVLVAFLLLVGELNGGLVAVADFDLVATLFGRRFGETAPLTLTVYALVGLAGVYAGLLWEAIQRRWQVQLAPARAR